MPFDSENAMLSLMSGQWALQWTSVILSFVIEAGDFYKR